MFYYFVFIGLGLFALFDMKGVEKSKRDKFFFVLIVLFFILISGLRWNTGNDWNPYKYYVENFDLSDPFFKITFEPGFAQFVNLIEFFFGNSFTAYLLVFALVNIGIKSYFIYKEVNALLLALLLFWCLQSLADITATRQSLAIAICLLSVFYIEKRKIFIFLLIVFLAMSIHVSAFIFLLAYPIYYAKWSINTKYILLLVFIVFAIIGSADYILNLILNLPFFGRVTEKAIIYKSTGSEETYSAGVGKSILLILGFSKRIIIFPIIFYFEKKLFGEDQKFKAYSNLFLFGNLIYLLIGDFLTFQRIASYFYFFEIILISWIFQKLNNRKIAFFLILFYALIKLVFIIKNAPTNGGVNLLDPYIWIFSDNTDREMF